MPTEIGIVVTKLLVKNFPYIFDTQYTATLEGELDAVEDGQERWTGSASLTASMTTLRRNWLWPRSTWKTSSGWKNRPLRSARQVRLSADSEVGQVWKLLFVLELYEVEANDCRSWTVEEGPEGDREKDHLSV